MENFRKKKSGKNVLSGQLPPPLPLLLLLLLPRLPPRLRLPFRRASSLHRAGSLLSVPLLLPARFLHHHHQLSLLPLFFLPPALHRLVFALPPAGSNENTTNWLISPNPKLTRLWLMRDRVYYSP